METESREIVIALRRLTFLDCACLQTLEIADACARRVGVRLVIEHPPPAVSRLLELTGFAKRLTILNDRKDERDPVATTGASGGGRRAGPDREQQRDREATT